MESNQTPKETGDTDSKVPAGIFQTVFNTVLAFNMPTWIKVVLGAVVGAVSTAYYLLF
jgi:hypothetical protein